MTDRPWLYLGCGEETGHYLWVGTRVDNGWAQRPQRYHRPDLQRLESCDGFFPPQVGEPLYAATFSRLPGWGYSVLSWWDQSVDERGRSNSTVFCSSSYITSAEVLIVSAKIVFPWVFKRLPQPLTLWIAE